MGNLASESRGPGSDEEGNGKGAASAYIIQVSPNESACTGCGTCELVCALVHEGATSPALRRIWLERRPFEGISFASTCEQCDDAECYDACPLKDEALCIDPKTGIKYINVDECIGCGDCVEACPYDPPRINFDPERNVAIKCDLCMGREGGPACVEFCPAHCLILKERRAQP